MDDRTPARRQIPTPEEKAGGDHRRSPSAPIGSPSDHPLDRWHTRDELAGVLGVVVRTVQAHVQSMDIERKEGGDRPLFRPLPTAWTLARLTQQGFDVTREMHEGDPIGGSKGSPSITPQATTDLEDVRHRLAELETQLASMQAQEGEKATDEEARKKQEDAYEPKKAWYLRGVMVALRWLKAFADRWLKRLQD